MVKKAMKRLWVWVGKKTGWYQEEVWSATLIRSVTDNTMRHATDELSGQVIDYYTKRRYPRGKRND